MVRSFIFKICLMERKTMGCQRSHQDPIPRSMEGFRSEASRHIERRPIQSRLSTSQCHLITRQSPGSPSRTVFQRLHLLYQSPRATSRSSNLQIGINTTCQCLARPEHRLLPHPIDASGATRPYKTFTRSLTRSSEPHTSEQCSGGVCGEAARRYVQELLAQP